MAFTEDQLGIQKRYKDALEQEKERILRKQLKDEQDYELYLLTQVATQATDVPFGGEGFLNVPTGGVGDALVKAIAELVSGNEGDYESVRRDDNGSLSIGKFQWHGQRARELLATIQSDTTALLSALRADRSSLTLTEESNKSWGTYIPSVSAANAISVFISSSQGQAAQDLFILKSMARYMKAGYDVGVRTPEAMCFFCDMYNQAPTTTVRVTNAAAKWNPPCTLEAIYRESLKDEKVRKDRRHKVYNKLKADGFAEKFAGWDVLASLNSVNSTGNTVVQQPSTDTKKDETKEETDDTKEKDLKAEDKDKLPGTDTKPKDSIIAPEKNNIIGPKMNIKSMSLYIQADRSSVNNQLQTGKYPLMPPGYPYAGPRSFGRVTLNDSCIQTDTLSAAGYPPKIILPEGSRQEFQMHVYNYRKVNGYAGLAKVDSPYLNFYHDEQRYLDPKMAHYLEILAQTVGEKLNISSGWRSDAYNKSIDGATYSPHGCGYAVDLRLTGSKRLTVANAANSIGFGGIAIGDDFVHIDISVYGRWKYGSVNFKYNGPGDPASI